MGNYSRFIRPGFKRLEVDGADELNGLMSSSWLSPDGNTLVSVLVNMSRGSRHVNLALSGSQITGVKTYVTDKEHDLQYDATLSDAADMQIPARSVVTVVMSLTQSSGISDVKALPTVNDGKIWSLSGRQVNNPQKGIFIRNGKKYILK